MSNNKIIKNINFPDKGTNVIISFEDGTRVVFASLEIRNAIAEALINERDIDLEFDHEANFVELDSVRYSASVSELEPGSWLFFRITPTDN